jgi:hypothetical protein
MQQITIETAHRLALADPLKLREEIRFESADWIREEANRIADVETGRADKTYCGMWPRGWRAAMKLQSAHRARVRLIDRWMLAHCLYIDGVLWLCDWQIINSLKSEA